MLVAMLGDQRVMADVAERGGDYRCPGCRDVMMVKQGRIVIEHFAHYPSAICDYGSGETQAHYMAKLKLHAALIERGLRAEVEYRFDDQRADVAAWTRDDRPVAFEFQHTSIGLPEIEQRVHDYARKGIGQIWIPFLLRKDRTHAEDLNHWFPSRRFERFICALHFNRVWLWDETVQAFRFGRKIPNRYVYGYGDIDSGFELTDPCDPKWLRFKIGNRQAFSTRFYQLPAGRLVDFELDTNAVVAGAIPRRVFTKAISGTRKT
jgi:competence protein CoiA